MTLQACNTCLKQQSNHISLNYFFPFRNARSSHPFSGMKLTAIHVPTNLHQDTDSSYQHPLRKLPVSTAQTNLPTLMYTLTEPRVDFMDSTLATENSEISSARRSWPQKVPKRWFLSYFWPFPDQKVSQPRRVQSIFCDFPEKLAFLAEFIAFQRNLTEPRSPL